MTDRQRLVSRLCAKARNAGVGGSDLPGLHKMVEEHLSENATDGRIYDRMASVKSAVGKLDRFVKQVAKHLRGEGPC